MSKRLTDTEIWNKDWFLDLPDKQKLLVKFLYDNCDCAGIYEISWRKIRYSFTDKITKEDFENIKQIKFISENKIFIEDFIKFQYGSTIEQLNPKFSVHKGVIKQLQKNGLITVTKGLSNSYETLIKPFENGYNVTVQNKDKDKDNNTNNNTNSINNTNNTNTNSNSNSNSNTKEYVDLFVNKYKLHFEKEYKRVFKNKPFLSQQDCYKIIELSQQYDEKTITEAIERLKNISFADINFKPTASWLLKDNNFERVMNGEFESNTEEVKFEY